MGVTSGFFNSLNGDRKYNSEQFGDLLSNLINDGIHMNVGDSFKITSTSGFSFTVGSGRAWLNGKWIYNDSALSLSVDNPDMVLNRIDTVVIEINTNDDARTGSIKIIKGTPASTPVHPELVNTNYIHTYPLADITINAGCSAISQSEILNRIGKEECPFISGVLSTQTIEFINSKWDAEFNEWFSSLQIQLEGDVATKLVLDVSNLQTKSDELQTGIDNLDESKAPKYQYSTQDLTPEVSELPTGTLYFVI